MYPPPPVILPELADFSTRVRNPYSELGPSLSNISRVSVFAGDCLTMQATLAPTMQSDCEGHFVNIPALPHSVMVFHNCGASLVCFDFCLSYWTACSDYLWLPYLALLDLIGQALSEFTGVDIPFKTQTSEVGYHDLGMRIISWTVRLLSRITWLFPLYSNNSFSSIYPYRIVTSAYPRLFISQILAAFTFKSK